GEASNFAAASAGKWASAHGLRKVRTPDQDGRGDGTQPQHVHHEPVSARHKAVPNGYGYGGHQPGDNDRVGREVPRATHGILPEIVTPRYADPHGRRAGPMSCPGML